MAESPNQAYIREYYSILGDRLFRNNVGVLVDKRGIPVRFGLANDSAKLNEVLKSGDLIGWRPTLITPDMVGEVFARFLSIEVKPPGWKPPGVGTKGRKRVDAQLSWADLVRAEGGIAGIMTDPEKGFIL